MILTIIETGLPPEAIRNDWPDYPAMFESLLAPTGRFSSFQTVSVIKGNQLPDPATLDAILITGSKAGVYEDEPWIPPLLDFIRWAAAEETPQVGVCFGHQAMAQALGGRVIKSPKGWGIGLHEYRITASPDWLHPRAKTATIAVSHQDQVVTPPPGAKTLFRTDFTPFAGLIYAQGPAISLQGHPEFDPEFSNALFGARLGNPLTEAEVTAAARSFDAPLDQGLYAQWIANFYRHYAKSAPEDPDRP